MSGGGAAQLDYSGVLPPLIVIPTTAQGFSSKDIRTLGGSELQRIGENYAMDHEWSGKGEIETHPPPVGCRVVVELYTGKPHTDFLRAWLQCSTPP